MYLNLGQLYEPTSSNSPLNTFIPIRENAHLISEFFLDVVTFRTSLKKSASHHEHLQSLYDALRSMMNHLNL